MRLYVAAVLFAAGIVLAALAAHTFVTPVASDRVYLTCSAGSSGSYSADTGGGVIEYTCGSVANN